MRNYFSAAFCFLFVSLSTVTFAQEKFGIASYYSDAFQGRKTASGEPYDKNKLTGAHKTYEFGTIVKVTRLDNKKSVNIRINDRGPYINGRIIDVSKAAAAQLDLIADGRTEVKVELVGKADSKPEPPKENEITANNQPNLESLRVNETPEPTTPRVADVPTEFSDNSAGIPKQPTGLEVTKKAKEEPAPAKVPNLKIDAEKAPKAVPTVSTSKAERVIAKDYQNYDLYKIQLLRPERKGFGVQVASLTKYEHVMKQVAELQESWFNNILVSVEKGKDNNPVYKIILGPFENRDIAESYKKQLKTKKKINGFTVNLADIQY